MTSPSRNIGRFLNAELIGRGGFGSVYRAADTEHGRDVAIKVLQGSLGETERRRFDRERQTMGRLGSHPNIMPVHESGYTDAGEGYIVMDLATGGSLRDRLDSEQTMPWEEATLVAIAVAEAAQAAHDQGVLHRDIKPDNILIDVYGNPRLTDFGIAAVASNATATTSTTATLAHAAPELLQGHQSTTAVDIYAVGSTLYNLITGWPPFQRPGDEGITALITRALSEPPPDLGPYGVPNAVAEVAARALAKEPQARQGSAAQLATELTDSLAAAKGASAGSPSPTGSVAPATIAAIAPTRDPLGAGPAPSTSLPSPPSPPAPPSPTAPPTPQPSPGQPSQPVGAFDQTVAANYQAPIQATRQQPSYQQPQPDRTPGPGPGAGYGAPPARSSGRKGLWLAVGVLCALAVVGLGALLVTTNSGGSNRTPGIAAPGEGGSTTTPSTSETTQRPQGEESSTTQAAAAATASTTTSTTTTAAVDPDCPQEVFDGQTPRFNVQICGNGTGALRYVASNRSTGDGIELDACSLGSGAFEARNSNFVYKVDTGSLRLTVVDPGGELIVDEPIFEPVATDFSFPLDAC